MPECKQVVTDSRQTRISHNVACLRGEESRRVKESPRLAMQSMQYITIPYSSYTACSALQSP